MNHNKPKLIKSSIKNVQFGKNVKIIEPVNLYDCIIVDNVIIGVGSVLTKDVLYNLIVFGNPAKIYEK